MIFNVSRMIGKSFFAITIWLGFAVSANAIVIDFGPGQTSTAGGVIGFNLVTPTSIVGDATLSVTVQGDINSSDEGFEVLLDAISLGVASNVGAGTDPFPGIPDSYSGFIGLTSNIFTDDIILSNSFLAPLISDGSLIVSFDLDASVGAVFTPDPGGDFSALSPAAFYVQGSLSFDTPSSAVPEPGTLALIGLGLVGIGFMRKPKYRS